MFPVDGSSTQLSELWAWYEDASGVIADLDSCRVIVEAMQAGSEEANLTIAPGLDAITRHVELWLLSHPCPDHWNWQHMMAIVDGYKSMGACVTDAAGDGSCARSLEFQSIAVDTELMLQEVKQVIALLAMTAER